jgi:hypothetical protein
LGEEGGIMESDVEIMLCKWLKEKGTYIEQIYFNRKNTFTAFIFTTTGLNRKPDFIIKINRGYGDEYIAVEIKDNTKSSQVYDSNKILEYYENYRTGKTIYYIDNQSIQIKYFVVATQGSPESKLLNDSMEREIINNLFDLGGHRKGMVNFGNEPEFEWNATSQFLRNLFALFRKHRKDNDLKDTGGSAIGILTSEIKEEFKEGFPIYISSKIPYIFIMNYNNYNSNYKAKWGCRYWRL